MAAQAVEGKVAMALRRVIHRVQAAAEKAGRRAEEVRVVAVGKTKSVSLIRDVYDVGHRCFGENYVQEFIQKAPQLPDDINWHFIGHIQSNKVKPLLAAVPNLDMVESVDSEKIAIQLDRMVASLGRRPLKTLCCCKDEVCKALGIPEDYCELSMGMSGDFEQAIEMGSTNVRIGSTIFGPREYPKKEKKESVNLLTSSIS
ncbi:hypothetical protein HPP92_008207 [Vanilla planifolia]|uniref:Pyridoxal phosphate homeostasis protein n=1 Tax=Vanilla planifolia TaxID=51239 RepID=A0A835RBN9_VANPL|nr:hypothetical protein HPP92_008207 [Vanilla planifolia]